MQSTNNRTMYILLGAAVLVILTGIGIMVSSRLSATNRSTPTFNVDAIYTAAYQTIAVEQTAQQASNPPTTTPALNPSATTEAASLMPINTLILASSTGTVRGCDNSMYLSDVTIPDGTVMTPGQTFTKTWAVQNTGTCPWSTSYKLGFAFGTAMNGASTGLPQSVAPGAQAQISVNLAAPTGLGNYTGNWKLQNDQGQYFGTLLTVVINVVPATSTSTTAGATLAPTSTRTPASTPTNTPTSTSTPTSTP